MPGILHRQMGGDNLIGSGPEPYAANPKGAAHGKNETYSTPVPGLREPARAGRRVLML